jgi:dTDP-4-dehydrorhamnose 3,5-epimerase
MEGESAIGGGDLAPYPLMPFDLLPTHLDGPKLLAPTSFGDHRGFFVETFRRSDMMALGIVEEMVQGNHSRSTRGVVRGMHVTVGRGAGKLVRCARGHIHDVLVDLRRGSPTYGRSEGYDLTDENLHILYAPPGFAHGFCVVSDVADVTYQLDAYYDPATERELRHDDPAIGVIWPVPAEELQVSQRDLDAPLLAEIADDLPFQYFGSERREQAPRA